MCVDRRPAVTVTVVPPAPTSTTDGPSRMALWELFGLRMPAKAGRWPGAPMLTHERPVDVETVTLYAASFTA